MGSEVLRPGGFPREGIPAAGNHLTQGPGDCRRSGSLLREGPVARWGAGWGVSHKEIRGFAYAGRTQRDGAGSRG